MSNEPGFKNRSVSIPAWVERELARPALEGSRNDQLIKIGPELLRCGYDVDSLFELFTEFQPSMPEREVMGICKSALKYVEIQGERMPRSAYLKQRRHLHEVTQRACAQLPSILADYAWSPSEFTTETSTWPLAQQRSTFIHELFNDDDVIWIGEVWETGERVTKSGRHVNYRNHFKTVAEWLAQPNIRGEFTAHCTFKPGVNSRSNESLVEHCYLVVESDILSTDQIGAVFNYIAQTLDLKAIVSTGGKSVHAWFQITGLIDQLAIAEWGAALSGYKCDPATLKPSQPVRLPGCIRKDTGRPQQLLYLT